MSRFYRRRVTTSATPARALHSRFRAGREGAAAVEFAFVFPLFLLLVFGAIDVGRAIMVQHKLAEAARAGCRLYLVKNEVTQDEARQMVEDVMSAASLDDYTVEFDPASSEDIEQLAPVTVSVSIPQDRVSWMRLSWFAPGSMLTGTCIMPGDTGEVNRNSNGNTNTNGNGDGGGGGHSGTSGNQDNGNSDNGGNGSGGNGGFWGWLWHWFTR